MSDQAPIETAKFQVFTLTINDDGWPTSVELVSDYFQESAGSGIGLVEMVAELTKDEAMAIHRVFEDVARRVQAEMRSGLE